MNEDILRKYEEYKQTVNSKEKYKLLSNFAATNPGDVNEFLDLLEGKKDLNNERNRFCLFQTQFLTDLTAESLSEKTKRWRERAVGFQLSTELSQLSVTAQAILLDLTLNHTYLNHQYAERIISLNDEGYLKLCNRYCRKKGTYGIKEARKNRAIKRWLDELCEKSFLTKRGDNQYQISPFVSGFKSQDLIIGDQVDKLAIETLITEDNMVQLYFSETQRKELANLLSTRAYQQIFTNGKVKYPFSGEEEFVVEKTRFTATFETYRIGGKNKVVLVDEPKFDKNNSEKAVDAVYQARLRWAMDYKHNKKSTVKNIKDLSTGQVKSIMMNVVNYNKDSFKKQMKELGVGHVNIEKMFNGSKEMVGGV